MIGKQLRKTKKEHGLSDSFDFDSMKEQNQSLEEFDIPDDKEYSRIVKQTENLEPKMNTDTNENSEKISDLTDDTDTKSENNIK
jgi:hypothetical protein